MRALRSLAVIALRQASSTAWAPAGAAVAAAKDMEENSSARISTREKRVIVIVGSFLELWLCASWLYRPNEQKLTRCETAAGEPKVNGTDGKNSERGKQKLSQSSAAAG